MDFNWQEGLWHSGDARAVDARIMVTGDWGPIRNGEAMILADPEGVYGDLLPELRRSDLRIVNLECVLGSAGAPILKAGPNLRADGRGLVGLTAVPFHVACLANNHSYDYGPDGFRQTATLLHEAGMKTVGAGLFEEDAVRPLVVEAGRARVGLVNFCEGEDCTAAADGPGVFGWQVDRVLALVRGLRREADVVLVIFHGGREHSPLPPPYVVETLRRVADAGADAVLAHHPHVPQGVEVHNGVPIAYSLGNFLFEQNVDLFYRRTGYMVELLLSRSRLSGLRLLPYRFQDTGLRLMQGDERRWFLDRLRRVSQPLADPDAVHAAWGAFIEGRREKSFPDTLEWVLGLMRQDLPVGAAKLRNLFVTPAHLHLWIDGTSRIVSGQAGASPEWAGNLVQEWGSLTVDAALRFPT